MRIGVCPSCGQSFNHDHCARSRVDSLTDICNDCGMRESGEGYRMPIEMPAVERTFNFDRLPPERQGWWSGTWRHPNAELFESLTAAPNMYLSGDNTDAEREELVVSMLSRDYHRHGFIKVFREEAPGLSEDAYEQAWRSFISSTAGDMMLAKMFSDYRDSHLSDPEAVYEHFSNRYPRAVVQQFLEWADDPGRMFVALTPTRDMIREMKEVARYFRQGERDVVPSWYYAREVVAGRLPDPRWATRKNFIAANQQRSNL